MVRRMDHLEALDVDISAMDLKRERDLYWELLSIGLDDEPRVFLERTLSLFIDVAGARRGYIELRDIFDGEQPTFSLARGLEAESMSPDTFSRTIINEAFATGETVVTASAQLDPRFQDHRSVRAKRLEAVLCAPIGRSPVLGVIYLQDRAVPGPFSPEDRRRAEIFARHAGGFAERLLSKRHLATSLDPTQPLRRTADLSKLIGSSEALAQVFQQISSVAPLQVGVLLTGAGGTGKTQLARTIHDNSPRAGKPFVELNCAALPVELIESELFGASAGAHSTARRPVPGKIQAAEGGTLFLDEVTELPPRAQAVLLQLLQSGTYYPLGQSSPRRANIRLIAATNADLALAVAQRKFREDLFFRLNVFPIRVPTLAERRGDIAALAHHFCKTSCEGNGLSAMQLSAGAILALQHAEWPGNVRDLAHTVEAGIVRANGEGLQQIERRHLFPVSETSEPGSDSAVGTFHGATRRFQEHLLRRTLEREGWNVTAVARVLDLTRAHVYNLIATFGLTRPGGDSSD